MLFQEALSRYIAGVLKIESLPHSCDGGMRRIGRQLLDLLMG